MKRIIKSLAIAAVSALAFSSCSQEQNPVSHDNGFHFTIRTSENPQVKSFIENNLDGGGTYTPKWSKDDKLAIFIGTIDENTKPTATLTNISETGLTAYFDGQVTGIGKDGTFKSFAPAKAFATGYSNGNVGITLAETQKPSSLTIDEACDILVAKETSYTADAAGEVAIDDLFFKRMFSVVKVALTGPESLKGQKVSKFSLSAPEGTVLTGRAAINLTTASIDKWNIDNNSVTATYEADAPVFGGASGLENAVWLVVNPCTVARGAKVVFAGETANYTFSKEVTLSKALTFPESQLAVINLTLAEENCSAKQAESRIYVENFNSVKTNKSTPQPSATGAAGTGVSDKLKYIYSGKNTNIRQSGNGHSSSDFYLYISTENDSFVVDNIAIDGETSLMLSAQVRSNTNQTTVSVYYKESSTATWTNASTTMTATSESFDTVQKVFLNIDSSVKSLALKFEATGGTLVDDIVLERFVDSRVKLESPTLLSANVDEAISNKVNLSWGPVSNANSYEIVLSAEGKADIVKTAETNSLSIDGLEYSTSYSIKVKAVSPDAEKYFDSDYCTSVTVTTGAKPEGGSTTPVVLYTLTPKNGKNSSYAGNCDVTIDGIVWNLTGNSQFNPWRLGGKNITNVNRSLYSKTAYPKALTSMKITFGEAKDITVNSCKLVYSTSANFTNSKECNIKFTASSTVEVTEDFPANAYYKLVINVTIKNTTKNKFVELSKIEFLGLDN